MNVEYHKWWSQNLGQDMELKVYGHTGKAVVVFSTSGGRFYQYEDFQKGLLNPIHLIYAVSLTAFFLILNNFAVEWRKY